MRIPDLTCWIFAIPKIYVRNSGYRYVNLFKSDELKTNWFNLIKKIMDGKNPQWELAREDCSRGKARYFAYENENKIFMY